MTVDVTDFTSYDEVRIIIGLSKDELPDATLALELFANSLEQALDSVTLPTVAPGPGPLKTAFLAIPVSGRTAAQQSLYNMTRLYSAYVCAHTLCVSLPMHTAKIIADGKRSLTRFSPEAVFKDTVTAITAKVAELRSSIENINTTEVESLIYLTAVKPAVDITVGDQ